MGAYRTNHPSSRFQCANTPKDTDRCLFRWEVDALYFPNGSLEFFCKYTLPVLRKTENSSVSWKQLAKKRHCHWFRALAVTGDLRNFLIAICEKRKIDSESFYQLPGLESDAHRIIGYRRTGTFYLIYDDRDHCLLPSRR